MYEGIEESIKFMNELCAAQGPFVGVIGFSQGAGLFFVIFIFIFIFIYLYLFAFIFVYLHLFLFIFYFLNCVHHKDHL